MSRVFEALQKTRAARKREDNTAPLTVQELIQRIESAEATDRKASVEPRVASARPVAPIIRQISEAASSRLGVASDSSFEAPHKIQTAEESFEQFRSQPIRPRPEARLVSVVDPQSAASEAFRLLTVRLRHLRRQRPLQKLLITSTSAKEGKSLVSANLSCTLALGESHKVLLIEGDLRCPTLSHVFGLPPSAGLCEFLAGKASLQECVLQLQDAKIWILPAGSASSTPIDLLNSSAVSDMMEILANLFDWIIVDAPPSLPLADTSVWERLVDGTLLVARIGLTKKGLLAKGFESMDLEKLVGTVLNCSEESLQYGDYYHQSAVAE